MAPGVEGDIRWEDKIAGVRLKEEGAEAEVAGDRNTRESRDTLELVLSKFVTWRSSLKQKPFEFVTEFSHVFVLFVIY